MCWITLTPRKGKNKGYRPTSDSSCVEDIVRVHHNPASPRLTNVRVKVPSVDVEVDEKLNHVHFHPHLEHHHRHPHLHPLHMHPVHGEHHLGLSLGLGHHHHYRGSLDLSEGMSDIKLHGQGRKRSMASPSAPPPSREPSRRPPPTRPSAPTTSSSSIPSSSPPPSSPSLPPTTSTPADTSPLLSPPSSTASPPREPIYRTQIMQPRGPSTNTSPTTVRETTRVALRTVQTDRRATRNNLRRVAGYQVLGRNVPWDWDCVSSSAPSNTGGNTSASSGPTSSNSNGNYNNNAGGRWVRRKGGGVGGSATGGGASSGSALKYPPFGHVEKWL